MCRKPLIYKGFQLFGAERKKMEEKNYFKCRNFRLNCFIRAFGERCVDTTINEKNNKRIWLFERSDRLDKILTLWDKIKDEIDSCPSDPVN